MAPLRIPSSLRVSLVGEGEMVDVLPVAHDAGEVPAARLGYDLLEVELPYALGKGLEIQGEAMLVSRSHASPSRMKCDVLRVNECAAMR